MVSAGSGTVNGTTYSRREKLPTDTSRNRATKSDVDLLIDDQISDTSTRLSEEGPGSPRLTVVSISRGAASPDSQRAQARPSAVSPSENRPYNAPHPGHHRRPRHMNSEEGSDPRLRGLISVQTANPGDWRRDLKHPIDSRVAYDSAGSDGGSVHSAGLAAGNTAGARRSSLPPHLQAPLKKSPDTVTG